MVPLSMFTEDGKMLKPKKSDFMSKLEELLPDRATFIESAEALIFDGMAIVQALPVQNQYTTFKEMAESFQKHILMKARCISGIKSIHVVFDKYEENSLKSETRQERGDISNRSHCVHVQGDLQVPKDWKLFLCNGKNKERLIEFYFGYLEENVCYHLHAHEKLIINGCKNKTCVELTQDCCREISSLDSNQEEADTLMLLHSKYEADTGTTAVVIQSPDTDVLVLMIHHYRDIGAKYMYMSTGRVSTHTDQRRFIPVHKLTQKLSEEQMNILLVIYCLSGCDTTSSMYGKGKKTVFKQMMQYASKYQQLKDIGKDLCFTKAQKMACTRFAVNLYGGSDHMSLNQLRYSKATKSSHPRSLPPTEDSFFLHCLRCVLQLWIWQHSLTPKHDLPPLTSFGYEYNENGPGIMPRLMAQSVAAPELLNDLTCECTNCSEICTCFLNQQPCTVACSCTANLNQAEMKCTNLYTLSSIFNQSSDSSDSEDDISWTHFD